ncbi:DNA primase family protein [Morganella morganii]|uniref:DNA primase family protein n=1 Tax=Morganella morganii TaxID=582 RepID=UPI002023B9B3|nr:DUF5906 domain-containing protein [Morganella morganii]
MGNFGQVQEKLPEWSDSLFTCVYQWIKQGTPPQKEAADASILRYPADHRLNPLAICMRSLVMDEAVTPDWFTEQGYHSAKNRKKAEEKRQALVLTHISQEELTSVLTDIKRINRLWPVPVTKPKKSGRSRVNLTQMADNEKALLLASRYDGIAIHAESEIVYLYHSGVWEKITSLELSREMVAIYNEHQTNFKKCYITNVIDTLKIVIPVMEEPRRSLIPFANGVYDMETGEFTEHRPDNWLTNHNGVEYTPAVPGENLHDHAPNFHKWLSHTAENDALKMQRIAAALFMVLANRYDWQLFLEITGEGGSGKSVFTQVATLLAGKHNTASGNMAALDDAGGRAQFVGKSLITLPDQPKYTGEGTGIKAITGGDAMEINPKYEKRYTAVLRAVVIATNNTPMIFTERAGGVARRRVIFQFNNRVREEDKDPELAEKIFAEIPVIIRRLLTNFADPEKARQLLLEQRDSIEALEIKRASNPVIDLCAALAFMGEPRGLMMGGGRKADTERQPRQYLYHLYLEFMDYMGLSRPLSVTEFGKAVKEAAKEYGGEYLTRTINGRRQTNVQITDKADEFL